jgi:hypothetical protein
MDKFKPGDRVVYLDRPEVYIVYRQSEHPDDVFIMTDGSTFSSNRLTLLKSPKFRVDDVVRRSGYPYRLRVTKDSYNEKEQTFSYWLDDGALYMEKELELWVEEGVEKVEPKFHVGDAVCLESRATKYIVREVNSKWNNHKPKYSYILEDDSSWPENYLELIVPPLSSECATPSKKTSPVSKSEYEKLIDAAREIMTVIEIQEGRWKGNYHLSAEAFQPLWDRAKQNLAECLSQMDHPKKG